MTLTVEPSTAPVVSTTPVGPPPPFDPELAPVLRIINELMPPIGPDTLQTMRAGIPGMEPADNETLARDGAFLVEERTVPGPAGRPDIAAADLPARGGVDPRAGDLPHPRRRHDHRRQPDRRSTDRWTGARLGAARGVGRVPAGARDTRTRRRSRTATPA